jgi:quercetin dioxygenase-like cupin family protein
MKDGKLMRAATDAEAKKAPPDAIRLTVTRYDFPGNSVRVAHIWPASSATAPASAKTDSLIYFTSGHVRFHQASQVHDVHAGDFIREDASQSHVWEHLTAGSFVTTSALPAGTESTPPAAAADRPATR